MATIVGNIRKDVERISKQFIRASMPEPKMLHAEICWNLSTIDFTWDWTKHTVASGLEKDFIKALEMERCKKSEAHILLLVGEQIDGCFIGSKTKRYWLKPVVR